MAELDNILNEYCCLFVASAPTREHYNPAIFDTRHQSNHVRTPESCPASSGYYPSKRTILSSKSTRSQWRSKGNFHLNQTMSFRADDRELHVDFDCPLFAGDRTRETEELERPFRFTC